MESTPATGPPKHHGPAGDPGCFAISTNESVRISAQKNSPISGAVLAAAGRGPPRPSKLPMKLSSELVHLGYNAGMVVHTFAFRWKPGVREDQKLRALAEIRGLQGQIPGLLETWVGVNVSPRSQGYELGGVMKFAYRPALDAYGAHPVHQKLLQWLMPLIDPLEVDFEA